MSMFNECHIHSCDCTWLNLFSHAQSLMINHKKIFEFLVIFGKYFVFGKIVKIFKNNVALFWWLSCGLVQSHTLVTSPYRDFLRLTGGSMSQLRKILDIFQILGFYVSHDSVWGLVRGWKVQSQGVHRDFRGSPCDSLMGRLCSHKKHLEKIFKFLVFRFLAACFGDFHATCLSRENRVFCILRVIFKVVFKHFLFFPSYIIFTIHTFISCPLFSLTPLSIRVKKGESILFLVHICRGEKFYFLCTFVGGEIHYICSSITCYTLRV